MALLPLQRREGGGSGGGEGGGVEGWRGGERGRERWRQRLFMCNDTITKPACKTQSANCAFEGDFQRGISVRQAGRQQERRVSRKTRLDVIDSGGVRACVFACTCVRAVGGGGVDLCGVCNPRACVQTGESACTRSRRCAVCSVGTDTQPLAAGSGFNNCK